MQNVVQKIKKSLSGIYPDIEITSLTRLIIEHVTGLPLPIFLSDKNKKILAEHELIIDKIVSRLLLFEPIQYILGETEFYGLPFVVNKDVLIPRPETEELVDLVISENNRAKKSLLDIGTGSGSIAIALKKYLPDSNIEAWDFSEPALKVAKLNAKRNGVEVLFCIVDVLKDYPGSRIFDVIISNPPYVMDSEKKEMSRNVLDYEPHSALFVPDENPLLFYVRIADIARKILNKGGKLYFEINRAKGDELCKMLVSKKFREVVLKKDIFGNDRIVQALLL